MGRVTLAPGVVLEELGREVMVLVPGSSKALTLSGDAAEIVRSVEFGESVQSNRVVQELLNLGVLEDSGVSRRTLVRASAIGAGAAIAVMVMPAVSYADSAPSESPLTLGEIVQSGVPIVVSFQAPGGQSAGVTNGTAGTFTNKIGQAVTMTWDGSIWSGSTSGKSQDNTDYWQGSFTFTFGGQTYAGSVK